MLASSCLSCKDRTGVGGFEPPSWREFVMGARAEPREPKDVAHVEEVSIAESLLSRLCDSGKALMRSQGGLGAGLAGCRHALSTE